MCDDGEREHCAGREVLKMRLEFYLHGERVAVVPDASVVPLEGEPVYLRGVVKPACVVDNRCFEYQFAGEELTGCKVLIKLDDDG